MPCGVLCCGGGRGTSLESLPNGRHLGRRGGKGKATELGLRWRLKMGENVRLYIIGTKDLRRITRNGGGGDTGRNGETGRRRWMLYPGRRIRHGLDGTTGQPLSSGVGPRHTRKPSGMDYKSGCWEKAREIGRLSDQKVTPKSRRR